MLDHNVTFICMPLFVMFCHTMWAQNEWYGWFDVYDGLNYGMLKCVTFFHSSRLMGIRIEDS